MTRSRFDRWFHQDANFTFRLIVGFVSIAWLAALIDWIFDLGWGWDRRVLIAAPIILGVAVVVRFWHHLLNKLFDRSPPKP
ncbi:hypothetical protein ACQKO5_17500 [Novosphingobium subterraneum]|uniref:hypothetical protein n=1 Tax=Novosphingobium subterraneum TaxID=48936 RepID=UPI003CFFC8CF